MCVCAGGGGWGGRGGLCGGMGYLAESWHWRSPCSSSPGPWSRPAAPGRSRPPPAWSPGTSGHVPHSLWTHTHKHTHTDTHTHTHTQIHIHTHTQIHRHTQIHTHTDMQIHTHTDTQIQRQTPKHTHIHACTQSMRNCAFLNVTSSQWVTSACPPWHLE